MKGGDYYLGTFTKKLQLVVPSFMKGGDYYLGTFTKKLQLVVPSFHKGGVRGGSCDK